MFRALKTILLLSFLLLTLTNVDSQTKFAVIGDYGDDNTPECPPETFASDARPLTANRGDTRSIRTAPVQAIETFRLD